MFDFKRRVKATNDVGLYLFYNNIHLPLQTFIILKKEIIQ